jgi:hypothetical protein
MIYLVNYISSVHTKPIFKYEISTTKVTIYCINITVFITHMFAAKLYFITLLKCFTLKGFYIHHSFLKM